MRLALFLLSAMVVLSQTQYLRSRSRHWWTPQQRVYKNYQPAEYDDYIDDRPVYRNYRPSRPIAYPQEIDELDPEFVDGDVLGDGENDYIDVQSRAKGFNRFKNSQIQQNARLFNLFNNTFTALLKTATFTLTSTINLTSVQSCISSSLFVNGSSNVICRRKRDIMELSNYPEDIQFVLSPTKTQEVIPTNLPSVDLVRGERSTQDDSSESYEIEPSLDEMSAELPSEAKSSEKLRSKRFIFNYYAVASKTVTSYSFVSTTVTKAVNIATLSPGATAGVLLCRPAGYVIC